MSFHEALKKLEASGEFKSFKEKNKNTFLFSAFFVLSENKIEAQQFNFYIPEKQEAVTFMLEETIKHKTEKFMKKDITELNTNIKIDLDELQDIVKKEAEKQKLKLEKIIAVLQKAKLSSENEQEKRQEQEEVQIWNVICLCGFKMLRMHVDCLTGEIFKSEQSSILDFIQVKK